MKKIFTSISLAAMTFMATMPAFAQQKQLTDAEKKELVETIVPAMFEQVKQISGIDIAGLSNPNIETIINSPLFGIANNNALRAASLNAVNIQPDSVMVDLSATSLASFIKKVVVKMSDYEKFAVQTASGRTVNVNLPKTMYADLSMLGIINTKVSLNFEVGKKAGLLPFSSLSATLDLGKIGSYIPTSISIPSGKLFTVKESSTSTGKYEYNVTLEEGLRKLEALKENPNYLISLDMTKAQTATPQIDASLYAKTISPVATIPAGDASVYLNPKSLTKADSILVTSYVEGTANKVEDYKKLTNEIKDGAIYAYTYKKTEKNADWQIDDITKTTIKGNTIDIDLNNIAQSALQNVLADIQSSKIEKVSSLNVTVSEVNKDNFQETVETKLAAKVSKGGTTEAPEAIIEIVDEAVKNDETDQTIATITVPATSKTVGISSTIKIKDNLSIPMTAYVYSDILPVLTSNETINPESEVKVLVAENGLYINNVENAAYTIVSMTGKVVANGIISGDNAFVATPSLQRGQIYILSVVENGAQKVVKFRK